MPSPLDYKVLSKISLYVDLTTADRSWRPTEYTPGRTTTTLACCGPDSADRLTYPHPHARAYRSDRYTHVDTSQHTENHRTQDPLTYNTYHIPRHGSAETKQRNVQDPLLYSAYNILQHVNSYEQRGRIDTKQHNAYHSQTYKPDINQLIRGDAPINVRDLNIVFDEDLSLSDIVLALQEYCYL